MSVKSWSEQIILPTYAIGKPCKNPVFLEKRVYQGSSGAVYPHPVIEKILDEKKDKSYHAVFLENDYIKVMLLPELGGRVQMAWDKSKQRHFVYYNQVIKPALVGLTGPWISGGIEFNWPQHHRPSTFEPTDFYIEENADGSITVWCNELERMFRTRGMAGFTLYPDKAYLEIKVKLYNRTNFPQTFLWWANPAVKVNDEYQSVFPPDVYAVFDHGKRDVSEFPIAKGVYYKVDYSPGTDISRYKNIPVPTSFMAINSEYDFIGGYENDSKGGVIHVANHHVSPGKKQWTWGNGDFGIAWDRNLTDEDGPYIELMCGVYTDNQPDFSWLMPNEEKTFSQFFIPYRDLGVVKCATKEAMVNLEFTGNNIEIKAFTTSVYPGARVILKNGRAELLNEVFDFTPATSFQKTVTAPPGFAAEKFTLSVKTAEDVLLVEYKPGVNRDKAIPEPAKAAQKPGDIASNEQLYLTGLHIEQYRHATYDPRPYYEEVLLRDPQDYRCNNALGLWYLRRGQFLKAKEYLLTAVKTVTERNPNPYDGEALYNLGVALAFLEQYDKAYNCFYKSVWNAAWIDSGYFQVARIDAMKQRWEEALDAVDRSLVRNLHNHKAHQLKVSILRNLARNHDALALCEDSLTIDRFNFSLYYEKFKLTGDRKHLEFLNELIRGNIHNYIEFALDYAWSGLYTDSIRLLELGIENQNNNAVYPMAFYYKAWAEMKAGLKGASSETLKEAAAALPDYCFPNQPEAVVVLEWAISNNPRDYRALYYLGNYWYAYKNYIDAVSCWERSVAINENFPTSHRNLALASFNKLHQTDRVLQLLEKAFELDPSDSRVFMELDQLYKRLNYTAEERLEKMLSHQDLINDRDDLYLEQATLYNILGQHEKAYGLIMNRKFHPWEGGEGKVTGQYVYSLLELAKNAIGLNEPEKAVGLLQKAQEYPDNLGEGKLYGARENELLYWLGVAFHDLGEVDKAKEVWEKAAVGLTEVSSAVFYNDQQPDVVFYQGLALQKLGKIKEAERYFRMLIDFGEEHLNDHTEIDYFAVSLPDLLIWDDNLDMRNSLLCKYLMGLGFLGLGEKKRAESLFLEVLAEDSFYPGLLKHLKMTSIL
jgi:tetratricopeptide (TPR) repeat protein